MPPLILNINKYTILCFKLLSKNNLFSHYSLFCISVYLSFPIFLSVLHILIQFSYPSISFIIIPVFLFSGLHCFSSFLTEHVSILICLPSLLTSSHSVLQVLVVPALDSNIDWGIRALNCTVKILQMGCFLWSHWSLKERQFSRIFQMFCFQ